MNKLRYILNIIFLEPIKAVVKSVKRLLCLHCYDRIASVYYREDGDIKYRDSVYKCPFCGKRKVCRETIVPPRLLYSVTGINGDLCMLMVDFSEEEIEKRVTGYCKENNFSTDGIKIQQITRIDGFEICVGKGVWDE